jgi:hypothetical protein
MTHSPSKPGDPERLPQQTTKEWIEANGTTGPINAPSHWRESLGLRRTRRRRPSQAVQLDIVTTLAEIDDTPPSGEESRTTCGTIGTSPRTTTEEC